MRRSPAVLTAVVLVIAIAGGTAAIAISKGDNATVRPRHTSLGTVLADAKGRTLYLFTKDKTTESTCSGACAVNWPPAAAGHKPTVGDGLDDAALGTAKRADGKVQVTYAGRPLYRFAGDAGKPGSVKGQGLDAFGGKWYVVGTGGKAITKAPQAAAPMSPSGY
jgi:predicted lipoprotein with Yx(FWY)xxD motif